MAVSALAWTVFTGQASGVATAPGGSKQDSFGKVGQDWASLGKFGQIWASVGKYGQVKASMGKYGQVWASMNIHINNFGQISKKQVITTKLQQFRRAN